MIINNPKVTLDLGTPNVDISSHVIAASFDVPQEVTDARTWGAPYASDVAAGAQSVALAVKWSTALAALLDGHEGEALTLTVEPKDGGQAFSAEVEFAYIPFGELVIGAEVESEIVLAVLTELAYA